MELVKCVHADPAAITKHGLQKHVRAALLDSDAVVSGFSSPPPRDDRVSRVEEFRRRTVPADMIAARIPAVLQPADILQLDVHNASHEQADT